MQATVQSEVHDISHCLIYYSLAISLLSEAAGLEQTIHHHHTYIYHYSSLVQLAVAFALHHDRPDLALEWLEQGHCLVGINSTSSVHQLTLSMPGAYLWLITL